ncbi:ABC transporter substrate-binding protein [Lysinibacillus telephonicus]|uniref:ABC transporter substrate-binding protein n=1 Tax=Lysinibacillus telephonicus TaxID=1714840 RepID=UPI0031FCDAD4
MKKIICFLPFMFVLIVLAACTNNSSTENEQSAETEEGTKETGTTSNGESKELTIAIGSDMLGFDIHNHNNTSTESIHQNMFDYLFKRDENNELQPWLAESYEILDDMTIEVKLKQGVKFHNGDEFKAEDVKFTLERVATDETLKENPNYKQIKEVKIIDDYTVQIITHAPEPSIIHRLSRLGSGMLPKKYIEENGWDYFLENPIGTGPYKYVEWVRDDRIVMEPFEDYFQGKVGEWDKVTFRIIPEDSTRVSELLTGGVDIATNIPPADWERVESNEGTSLKQEVSNRTLFIVLRATESYPTADVRVRQAIDYAIDDGTLTEFALQGAGIPTLSMVGPGNFGHEASLYDTYNYDLEKAKQLLEEAGYSDGFEMTLHAPKGRYLQDAEVAELIVGMLAQVGITVNLEFMEWSNFVELRNANENKDAYLLGLGNSMYDGAYSVDWYRSTRMEGHTDYKNEEIDQLLADSQVNMDPATREIQIQEIQKIVAEDVPHINLYLEKINTGVSDRINFTPTSDEMLYVPTITRN